MISSVLNLNRQTVHEILTFELGHSENLCQAGPQNSHQWTEGKPKERVPGPSWTHRKWQKGFKHVITGDETWIFEYDPDKKRQSSEWHTSNSPRPKKSRMRKSKIKTKLIRFFDSQGVVHKEFMPQGQTFKKQYYREVLERLRKTVHRVRPDCRHLDTAPRQCSLSHCHLSELIFGQKKYFSGSAATILAWVRVTSSFSQNSNSTLKVVFLELWTTSKRSWQTSRGHFYMKTSRTATGSGSKVSGGVWLPKGTTLKGIMLIYR